MKRVIVTGATSMLGIAVIEECIRNNIEVVAVIRENSTRIQRLPVSDLITKVYADSSDYPDIPFKEHADILYHFMWEYSHKEGRDNPLLQAKNIDITMRVIDYAHTIGCRRIVFAGSQAEYGPKEGCIKENAVVNPQTAYGMAKYATSLLAEKMCQQYGIEYIWSRIFSVYGKYDNDSSMISQAIDKLMKGEKVFFSSGEQYWNYLYESDAGKIFYALGVQELDSGIYNVANPTNRQLKEYINDILHFFPKAEYEFAHNEKGQLISLHADTTKLFSAIGNTDTVSFASGIKIIIDSMNKRADC